MEKRSRGRVTLTAINKDDTWNADGCATYSIYNAGNTNVTIDGILVLQPLQTWEGPGFHPSIGWYSRHTIVFDRANAPTIKTPVGGQFPPSTIVAPGDPVAPDNRVIIFKGNIE